MPVQTGSVKQGLNHIKRIEANMKTLKVLLTAALCAAPFLATPTVANTATPVGDWQMANGESRFEITACGDGTQLCAKLTWLRDDLKDEANLAHLGEYVLQGAQMAGLNAWRGQVSYDGDTFTGRLILVDADTIRLNGCKGIFCQSMDLVRVS